LLPGGGDPGAAFTAIIQLGTEAAVLLFFRRDIAKMVVAWWNALRGRDGSSRDARLGKYSVDARLAWWVIIGTIPIVILGVIFKDQIETHLRNLWLTAAVLALFALVLGAADQYGSKHRDLRSMRMRDAVYLGFAQAAALIPGVSRSGGTISMGLFLGLTREAAARYSFLLAIPAVVGSASYELVTSFSELNAPGAPGLVATIIAALVAFVIGYVVIIWFLRLISQHTFFPFVVYRVAIAAIIVAMLANNVIPATSG
jgi:undecaprenyl-diphosphatase